jgi:mRNA interferase MazF
MVIYQGDIFWVDLDEPRGSEAGYGRPHVVIQNNVFNQSRIDTVIVCVVTSNLRRATAPGNVLLDRGEANLPRPSVVNVSQMLTIDKSNLGEKIGSLSSRRVRQILNGLQLLTEPREPESQ